MTRQRPLGTVENRVQEVREQIAEWRATRERRGPMPAALWAAAAQLAGELGVANVARTLRVDYAALQRHVGAKQTGAGAIELVEFHAAPFPAATEGVGHLVEVSRADGSRLTVRLAQGCDFDLGALVCAFGRAS